jgi:hypothetical protein
MENLCRICLGMCRYDRAVGKFLASLLAMFTHKKGAKMMTSHYEQFVDR